MQVRVWNDNVHDYTETFRDENIRIPAGKFIMMDYDTAHTFLGTSKGILRDVDGAPDPRGFKKLRIDRSGAPIPTVEADPLKCIACGYKAVSQIDLSEHMKISHANQVAKDEEAEKYAESINLKSENEQLKQEIEALKAQTTSTPRKPGRPPKARD